MLKKHKQIKIALIIIGLIIIPLYSILFGINGDLIDMTFSQVGGRIDGKLQGLIIWGAICSMYFYFTVEYMFMMLGKNNKFVLGLVGIGCICLMVTVFLPFNTMMYPVSSEIHNNLVRVAVAIIIVAILFFVINLKNYDKKTFIISLISYLICIAVILVIFFKYRVSSIFQIAFVTLMCVYLILQFMLIEKSPSTDLLLSLNKKKSEIEKNNPTNAFNEEIESVFEDGEEKIW